MCKQGCADPGCEPVCASSLCMCQMQGQKVCFYRAKALWKCWHSCGRIKYFLPQHCGKDSSCPALLQAARYVNDPTAERFSSDICRKGMLPCLQEGKLCSHTSWMSMGQHGAGHERRSLPKYTLYSMGVRLCLMFR